MSNIFCTPDVDIPYANVSHIEKHHQPDGVRVIMKQGSRTFWLTPSAALEFQKGFYQYYDPQPVQWTEEAVDMARQLRRGSTAGNVEHVGAGFEMP
jgi:hypothetical protein